MPIKKQSAGIVLYKKVDGEIRVLLGHMGGPQYANKDIGAWGIPKGEFDDSESPLEAAKREFQEEIGCPIDGQFVELVPIIQKNGKKVYAFALEGDCDISNIKSNTFQMEWPPRSGNIQEFPETDRAAWFSIEKAKELVIAGQGQVFDELLELLK